MKYVCGTVGTERCVSFPFNTAVVMIAGANKHEEPSLEMDSVPLLPICSISDGCLWVWWAEIGLALHRDRQLHFLCLGDMRHPQWDM